MEKRNMGWIQKNEIKQDYWYVETFQKWLYRLYKTYNLNNKIISKLLDIHYQHYLMLCDHKISLEHYFDVCWKIVDKLNNKRKEKGITEMKTEIGKLYGFLQNRKKEEL